MSSESESARGDDNCDKMNELVNRDKSRGIQSNSTVAKKSNDEKRNQHRRLASVARSSLVTSFDDSLLLARQRVFNKSKPICKNVKLHNQRLGMFKRTQIVTSIDENFPQTDEER